MNFSHYQNDIFDWAVNGSGNAFVIAVAGSGKTTTLVELGRRLTGSVAFMAFNAHIRDGLKDRLSDTTVDVMTVNQAGYRAVRSKWPSTQVDGKKYRAILEDLLRQAQNGFADGFNLTADMIDSIIEVYPRYAIEKVLHYSRVTGTSMAGGRDAVAALVKKYDIELEPVLWGFAAWCVRQCNRIGIEVGARVVDFSDQIYMPTLSTAAASFVWKKYQWMLVDEAQDLSEAQFLIVQKSLAPGGRMIFVGDARQAIYGFAGADENSFQKIIQLTAATVLPLSICYRCPTSVLDLARRIVPQIEARPEAPAGRVVRIQDEDQLAPMLQYGDLVLCRTTAPLVRLCFKLIRQKISARVRGREIGQGLKAVVEMYEKYYKRATKKDPYKKASAAPLDVLGLNEWLEIWQREEHGKSLRRNGNDEEDPALLAVSDKRQCLREIWANCPNGSTQEVTTYIDDLFADDRAAIWLSTVHRAKGLEARLVAIIEPQLLPHPMGMRRPESLVQEYNLKYVAITRAQETLVLVGDSESFLANGDSMEVEGADSSIKDIISPI